MFDKLACQFINDTGIQATYCYSLPSQNIAMGNYKFLKKNPAFFEGNTYTIANILTPVMKIKYMYHLYCQVALCL